MTAITLARDFTSRTSAIVAMTTEGRWIPCAKGVAALPRPEHVPCKEQCEACDDADNGRGDRR